MATRSLSTLAYVNDHTIDVLRKHAKNRPLGDIEYRYNYVPPQPVLSCRTVNIDLPGTRTYRPRSTFDILEEQQRLIRRLYNKQISRPATSVPRPSVKLGAVQRPSSEHKKLNIEVKGRPVTALSYGVSPRDNKSPVVTPRRPKTTGRFRNVQPATDSFMVIKIDEDVLAKSQSGKELNSQIHSYWNSEENHLAQGIFMRGQKRPDDVPPKLDAWLTFGGAGGSGGEGVIDAFASFKNSEEYYNIEGSVGSRVAQQLQKGDAIRIGVNGVLVSQDFKVRKRSKLRTHQEPDKQKETQQIEKAGQHKLGPGDKSQQESAERDKNNEFENFELDSLEDSLEDTMEVEKISGAGKSSFLSSALGEEMEKKLIMLSEVPKSIPLSWEDQCSKPDVKVIHPKVLPQNVTKHVVSETQPVKFEKQNYKSERQEVSQSHTIGYKIKQRTPNSLQNNQNNSSKVKVVYIDPLTQEEDERIRGMSVDEIVNFKLERSSRESTAVAIRRSLQGHNNGNASKEEPVNSSNEQRSSLKRGGSRGSRPSSNSSQSSDPGRVLSPKLKTVPVHPSAVQAVTDDLRISTKNPSQSNEMSRVGKAHGKLSPAKPLHRSGAGQGSSIKSGPLPGDAEFIKITAQLKVTPGGPAPSSAQPGTLFSPYHFSPGSNTPRDPDYMVDLDISGRSLALSPPPQSNHSIEAPQQEMDPSSPKVPELDFKKDQIEAEPSTQINESADSSVSDVTPEVTAHPTTLLAISIPTADELSDRESPSHSPSHFDDVSAGQ